MKKIFVILFLIVLSTGIFAFDLVINGEPKATVIIPKDAEYIDIYAKDELIKYVKEISGATLPVSDKITKGQNVFIGQKSADLVLKGKFDWQSLKSDGILIKASNKNLILAGHNSGTLYAVYTFLEDQCGVKYIIPTEDHIPKSQNISCQNLNIKFVPPFFSRETNWASNNYVWEYNLKLKLNGQNNPVPKELGGHVVLTGFCHTFNNLMNPEIYGPEHPEWFAERDGKRVLSYAQPCLTNEDMTKEFIKNVLETMKNNPEDKIISCTQNDNQEYCTCEKCKVAAEKYGQSGVLINFINKVAKEVKKVYPDRYVETFAYQYTRSLPLGGVKPDDNVIIRLCSIECDFARPFDAITNKSFYDDLKGWSSIAKNLFIWDYSNNYSNYLIPHPDFQVQQRNMQIFHKNNVVAVFNEGDYENKNSFFGHYKRYIISKLLWDPYLDFDEESIDFFKAYYGDAWKDLYLCMKELDRPFRDNDFILLPIYMGNNYYYTLEDWVFAFEQFNKALDKVKDQKKYYDRVLFDLLCLQAGVFVSDIKMQDEIIKSGCLRIDMKDFLPLLDEYRKAEGVVSWAERDPYEDGPYFISTNIKSEKIPDICKDLDEDMWFEYEAKAFKNYYPEGDKLHFSEDSKASDGIVISYNPNTKWWYSEKALYDLAHRNWTTADVYLTYRVVNGKDHRPALKCGFYSPTRKKFIFEKVLYADDTLDNEYKDAYIYTINRDDYDITEYFWIGGTEEDSCDGVYVDRFFVIPR